MLDLKIKDTTIPIPLDLQINREFETNIFNRDPEVSDFTLPVDLPLTDELLVLLDMPHILANPKVKREYECELIVDGIYVNKVLLRVLRTKPKQRICQVSIIGNYGYFGKIAGDLKVNELTLGGPRLLGTGAPPAAFDFFNNQGYGLSSNLYYQGTAAGSYIRQINKGLIASDFLFPTAMDEKNNLEINHNTLKTDEPVRSIINAYDFDNDVMVDPILHYLNSCYSNSVWSSERHYWVPMFKLGYVIRQCFEEFGFTVTGSILSTLDTVLLYNTYTINKVAYNYNYLGIPGVLLIQNVASVVVPQNHMPRWKITDFITEVSKNFNLQFIINYTDKTVKINQLSSFNGNAKKDLSAIADPDPEISFEKTDFQNGYHFSFEWDAEDGESGADIKEDIADYNYRGTVHTVAGLSGISAPATFDIAYVKNLNAYYQYGGQDWFFYSHNLDKYKTSNNEQLQKMSTRVVPTNMKYINYTLHRSGAITRQDVIDDIVGPATSIGIEGDGMFALDLTQLGQVGATIMFYTPGIGYKTETHRLENVIQPHIVIWHGMQERQNAASVSEAYPMASSVPYDCQGFTIGSIALCWDDPEKRSLFWVFWRMFVLMLANALQVDYKVLMDSITYSTLDLNSDVIVIDHLQYLCRKANITMPFPSPATLTLVRI